jgi:hypothetical protein
MTAMELMKAHSELPRKEQLLVSFFIAADLMTKDSDFAAKLSRRHKEMDAGRKWNHADMLAD